MDNFNSPITSVTESDEKDDIMDDEEDEESTLTLSAEIEKVLGGTLEGAFELKGGMGLLVTIKKDNKPFALVIQKPSNGVNPKEDTDVYITSGIGK